MSALLRTCLAAMVLSGTAPAVTAQAAPRSGADAVRAADQAWLAAVAAKDTTRSVAFMAPDGAVLAPGAPGARGADAVRSMFEGFFKIPGFNLRWTPTSASVARSGELGYTSGTYAMEFADSTGHRVPDVGKYVTVWQKQRDGQWKVVLDIFNSDGPAASH